MIVDANLLIYAGDDLSPHHQRARTWLTDRLDGSERVGLPWPSLLAYLRLATHPRLSDAPLTSEEAWRRVQDWLDAPTAWIPTPGHAHAEIAGGLIRRYHLTGNLIPDAHLAALAIEQGVTLCSADTDFARFSELRWVNPLRE